MESLLISFKDVLSEIARSKGQKTESYHQALQHIQKQSRQEGIDAALKHVTKDGETIELDALLLCDRKGAGQQLAAQAGKTPQHSQYQKPCPS